VLQLPSFFFAIARLKKTHIVVITTAPAAHVCQSAFMRQKPSSLPP
jgi:hypothetical protein